MVFGPPQVAPLAPGPSVSLHPVPVRPPPRFTEGRPSSYLCPLIYVAKQLTALRPSIVLQVVDAAPAFGGVQVASERQDRDIDEMIAIQTLK